MGEVCDDLSKRKGTSFHTAEWSTNAQIWSNLYRIQTIPRALTLLHEVFVLSLNQPIVH